MTAARALSALKKHVNAEKVAFFPRFFKTGPGQYGEGDRFLGVTVPNVRKLAREYRDLPLREVEALLLSPFNEARLLGLLIMVSRYERGDESERSRIYRLYLKRKARVNNWNLVDSSAPYILGAHLAQGSREMAFKLAGSRSLWDRRIAVLASFAWIRHGDFSDALKLCARMLEDREDLMHKATGWMLREVGNRDIEALRGFLGQHASKMPRTMLRYAIEKLPARERREWMTPRS